MDKNEEKKAKDKIKRQEARRQKMLAGFEELELWLRDLLRAGWITLPDKPRSFWDAAAARMVDAQSPGAAVLIRKLRDLSYADDAAWKMEAIELLTQLWTLTKGFLQMDRLPEARQVQLRSVAGWGAGPKEVWQDGDAERLTDHWWVVARQTEKLDDITTQRNWLYGCNSGRFATVLYFGFKNTPIESPLEPGSIYHATMAFFPFGHRGVIGETTPGAPPETAPEGFAHWREAEQYAARERIRFPWTEQSAVIVRGLSPAKMDEQWGLQDHQGNFRHLPASFQNKPLLRLLALSGGAPLCILLLLGARDILPVGVWQGHRYQML